MANVYSKLNQARTELQRRQLKKSGRNKFAGYNYFELGDFLPTVQEIFANVGLCGVVSYGAEAAELCIFDCDAPSDSIKVTSPMSSAALKGAHDIQNLGAVQTYLRRYLWVTAMEIVEHDELDATLGAPKQPSQPAQSTQRSASAPAPASTSDAPTWQLLQVKLKELGVTEFGMKTVLTLCKAETIETIPEAKAMQIFKAVNGGMIKKFNAGQNSKGEQVIAPPVVDKPKNNSIQELERSAAALFDTEEGE